MLIVCFHFLAGGESLGCLFDCHAHTHAQAEHNVLMHAVSALDYSGRPTIHISFLDIAVKTVLTTFKCYRLVSVVFGAILNKYEMS